MSPLTQVYLNIKNLKAKDTVGLELKVYINDEVAIHLAYSDKNLTPLIGKVNLPKDNILLPASVSFMLIKFVGSCKI